MSDLKTAILPAAKVTLRRTSIPILGYLKIGDGKAVANNLDMEVTVAVDALDMAPTCVPAREFVKALAAVGNGRVSVNGTRAIVEGDRGQIAIGMLPASGWPNSPIDDAALDDAPIRLDTESRGAIARLLPSMSREEKRYYLNGIAFSGGYAVSTDWHRMRCVPLPAVPCDCGNNIILPAPAARWIAERRGDFTLDVGERGFCFANGAVHATGRMIHGTYPDFARPQVCPPADAPIRAALDAEQFADAVATVSALDRSRSPGVKLTIGDGRVVVESKQIHFDIEARAEVEAETFGDYEVDFNARYLLDIFRTASGRVEMRQESVVAPCRFVFQDSDDIVVLMAMRL